MQEERTDKVPTWVRGLWPVVLAAGVAAVLCILAEPISRNESHYWRMVLAAVGIGFVGLRWLVYSIFGGKQSAVTPFRALLAMTCTAAWFNYFQFDLRILDDINDYTDTAYYYTNSKYLEELDYYGLYATALLCDQERGSPRTADVRQYRDLRDYEVKPMNVAFEHGRQVKADNFTQERWDAYCHDITFFLDRLSKKALASNFFVDHGYNPPPTWTLVGGNLAEAVPVERLKLICHVDTVVLIFMFACVWWAFGLETMLFATLFYAVTFSGRWPILGQAIMRFDWVAGLTLGLCFLKKERYGLAGASMAYAAFNRVFPALFFLGWGLGFLYDTIRERRVAPKHVRFIAGAAVVGGLLVGGALVQYGPSTFAASAVNLKMHNETYSSHRVGLGDIVMYRGETTRDQINAGGGIYKKELAIRDMQWALRSAGIVAIAFIALYAWRTRRRDWELMGLAILPFFCMTNPQVNYYNLRILLYIWHGANLDKPIHRVFMALLFGIEVFTQYTKVMEVDRYATTVSTSVGIAVYLVVLIAWMALNIASPQHDEEPAPQV